VKLSGFTGSSDLLTVLNADVGGADTDRLTGGRSNAELADRKNPQNHGINPEKLDEQDFKQRHKEREIALVTAVTESYKNLWYPSATGQIVCKEIRTSGGEGGISVLEQIRKTLIDDCELITSDQINQSTLNGLKKIFFDPLDVVEISKIRENFCRIRKWPILASSDLLDQLIREGVNRKRRPS